MFQTLGGALRMLARHLFSRRSPFPILFSQLHSRTNGSTDRNGRSLLPSPYEPARSALWSFSQRKSGQLTLTVGVVLCQGYTCQTGCWRRKFTMHPVGTTSPNWHPCRIRILRKVGDSAAGEGCGGDAGCDQRPPSTRKECTLSRGKSV